MTTRMTLIFAALVAGILIMAGNAHAQGPSATLDSFSPNPLKAGERTTVQVKLRNTGVASFFRIKKESVPNGWNVEIVTTNPVFMSYGQTKAFTITVTPPNAPGSGTVRLGIEAEYFQNYVNAGTASMTFEVIPIPGDFYVTSPTRNAVIDSELLVAWSASNYADSYKIFIAKYVNSSPVYPAQFSFVQGKDTRFIFVPFDQFERATRYEVTVVAINTIGERNNSGGPISFTTKGPDPLGKFSIITPAPNSTQTLNPYIQWEPSENALSYEVYIFPEKEDGTPDTSNPARVVTGLNATAYNFVDPPLNGGDFYYASVVAVGELDTSLFNQRGPIRFFASGLTEGFELIAPARNAANQPYTVEFRWEVAPGAREYHFRIFDELEDGKTVLHHEAFLEPGEFLVTYYLPTTKPLIWGHSYFWFVDAIRFDEKRRNEGGPHSFTTTKMGPFDVLSPSPGSVSVPPKPLFQWEETTGAASYFVEIAPASVDGKPILSRRVQGQPVDVAEWLYNITTPGFEELDGGGNYLWRVGASDGTSIVMNYGGWQSFRVTSLDTFELISPPNQMDNVSPKTVLHWQQLRNAAGYRVIIGINGGPELNPIEITTNTNSVDLGAIGRPLNSNLEYYWTVQAYASDGSVQYSLEPWTFQTTERDEILACDLIDQLIGAQFFTEADFILGGITGSTVLDCSYYIRELDFLAPCVRDR